MVRLQEANFGSVVLTLAVFTAVIAGPGAVAAQAEAGVPVYDLSQCIDIALDGSRALAIAGENTFFAKHGVRRAWGAFLPDLTTSYTWQRSERTDFNYEIRDPNTGLLLSTLDLETQYKDKRLALNSNFNLFGGFGKFGELNSARNELRAAKADFTYSRQQVIQTVSVAYINLLRNQRLLDVAEEARDLAGRELEKAETYYRIGSAAKSDVLQAKVRLEQTRLDEIRARNAVAQSFADLAHAMNRPLLDRFEVDSSLLDAEFDVEPLDALFAEALQQRPDLQSSAFTLAARKGDVVSASSQLWPQLNLFGSYSRSENESEFRFGAQESDAVSWGYQVSWNVFDRFQTLSGRSQAKARQRIAEYNLDQARLDVQLEVRQLYNSLIEARERISLSRETIANAQEELRLAQERFKVGAGTMLEQITAQVNLSQAQSDEVQAISDSIIASLQMERAVGRPLDRLAR